MDKILPDKRNTYQNSRAMPDLEIPPDLTSENIEQTTAIHGEKVATLSSYQKQLQKQSDVDLLFEPEQGQWLMVRGSATKIWSMLTTFWETNGYKLDLDDIELGVMETDWRIINTDKKNRFRLFTESTIDDNNTYLLYLVNEQAIQQDDVWTEKVYDTNLEQNTLAALELYLQNMVTGSSLHPSNDMAMNTKTRSSEQAEAEIVALDKDHSTLMIPLQFDAAWQRMGDLLPQLNYQVEYADKAKGHYGIRALPTEKKEDSKWSMFIDKLKFWKKEDTAITVYIVSLTGAGNNTEVFMLNANEEKLTNEQTLRIMHAVRNAYNRN